MKSDAIAHRYRVENVLGHGSTGFVVAARHIHTDRRVTLKILTQPGARPNTAVAATLQNAHVARIIETGTTDDGFPFIATERLEGETLAGKTFPAGRAVSLIRQACAGLAEAHAKGLVHGDLKPQNLFLTTDGVLKILDFGMTMPLSEEGEGSAFFALPAYLAPEQLRDPVVDGRADIWALGVVLHELVTGKLPFDAETVAAMFVAVAYDKPSMLAAPDVPYELAKIVHDCLAKDPAGRPASVEALSELLEPFADAPLAESVPPPVVISPEDVVSYRPGPLSRMSEALQKSVSSKPPPLPSSRLGAKPRARAPKPPRLPNRIGGYTRGWLATQLALYRLRVSAATAEGDRAFERRQWGAFGVLGAAAAIGVVSLLASSPSSASAAGRADDDEPAVAASTDLAVLPFIPPSFALPEREETAAAQPAPESTPTALLPPPPPPAPLPPRPRLAVRVDPYAPPGFTHPTALRESRRR